jgi:hypothetical protein
MTAPRSPPSTALDCASGTSRLEERHFWGHGGHREGGRGFRRSSGAVQVPQLQGLRSNLDPQHPKGERKGSCCCCFLIPVGAVFYPGRTPYKQQAVENWSMPYAKLKIDRGVASREIPTEPTKATKATKATRATRATKATKAG